MANRKIGSLLVSVGADTKPLKDGLREAEQQVGKFGRTSSRVGARSRSAFAGAGAAISGAALAAVAASGAAAAALGESTAGIPNNFKTNREVEIFNKDLERRAILDANPRMAELDYWTTPSNIFREFGEMVKDMKMAGVEGLAGRAPGQDPTLAQSVYEGIIEGFRMLENGSALNLSTRVGEAVSGMQLVRLESSGKSLVDEIEEKLNNGNR